MNQLTRQFAFALYLILPASIAQAVTCTAGFEASNPDLAYSITNDGTVIHVPTGLMWKRCVEGMTPTGNTCSGSYITATWAQALALGSTSNFAGYTDWRLPSIKELLSLVENCRNHPPINDTIFPSTPAQYHWSSTPNANNSGFAWYSNFNNGGGAGGLGRNNSYVVRLVRGSDDSLTPVRPTGISPANARSDVPQRFTVSGTGFVAGTTFALENCEADPNYTPTLTPIEATFQCMPRLPGNAGLLVNNALVAGKTVFVDHPTRTGNPASRGVPSVKNVSLFNGNYHHEVTDLVVPGKGMPFTVSRSYNSYYSDYEAGRGAVDNYHPWRFNWDLAIRYIRDSGNLQISVDREDGSVEGFYKDTTDYVWYPINQGSLSTLRAETPSGFMTFTTRDGRSYVFENPGVVLGVMVAGRLQYIADRDDFRLTLHYGSNGKVDYVTDTVNRVHNFSYWPGTINLKSVTDSAGRTVSYTWESDTAPNTALARDRIKTVVDVRTNTTTYNYWSNGSSSEPRMFLSSIVDARSNTVVQLTHAKEAYGNWGVKSLTDASLNVWAFQYCAITSLLVEYCGTSTTADTAAFVTKITAPLAEGNFKSHFDLAGRYAGKTDVLGHKTIVNPMPTTGLTLHTYAQAGLVQSRQTPEGAAATTPYNTQYGYTPESNLLTQTNPDSGVRQNSWSPGGSHNCFNLDQTKSPQQVTRTMGYTTTCKPTTTSVGGLLPSVNTYDPVTKLLSMAADPLGIATAYTYDALGNVLTETNSLLQTTTYTYDPLGLGRVIRKAVPGGLVTTYVYDAAGNLTQETQDPTGLNLITRYQYDENGNQWDAVNPRGFKTETFYDEDNRATMVTRFDELGGTSTTAYSYDRLGRISFVQNANLHKTRTTYQAGNIKTRTDALPRTTTYDIYDNDNRLKQQTDPEGRITTFDYDKMGRVTKVTTPDGSIQTSYDTDGRVSSLTDKKGIITTFGYDPAGRRNRVTSSSNFPADTTNTYMWYYDNGLLWKVQDPRTHITIYAYDELGRLASITDPKGRAWTTTYDFAGNVYSTLDPAGNLATYRYDKANRLIGTTWSLNGMNATTASYGVDKNGNVTSKTDSTGTTLTQYDGLDRISQITNPQGQIVKYAYDPAGNIVTLTYPGNKIVTYRYDAAERMTGLSDWAVPPRATNFTLDKSDRVTAIARVGNGTNTSMAYDPAGRLTSLIHRNASNSIFESHDLVRDANGNIQTDNSVLPLQPSLAAGTLTRTYDTDNRQNGITHDVAGRVTNNGTYTLGWNPLQQVDRINGELQSYTAEGARVTQIAGGVTTRFVMDTNAKLPNLLVETDAANTVQRYYIHSDYGLVEQIDAAGNPKFYHFDPSSNTRALTNASGQVTDTYAYTPFGVTTRAASNTTPNPFQFVGQYGVRNFNNTQLYDMRARWYAADQARFMSLDPLMGDVSDPQTLNRYAYVGGNPVTGMDPSGLEASQIQLDQLRLRDEIARRRADSQQQAQQQYQQQLELRLSLEIKRRRKSEIGWASSDAAILLHEFGDRLPYEVKVALAQSSSRIPHGYYGGTYFTTNGCGSQVTNLGNWAFNNLLNAGTRLPIVCDVHDLLYTPTHGPLSDSQKYAADDMLIEMTRTLGRYHSVKGGYSTSKDLKHLVTEFGGYGYAVKASRYVPSGQGGSDFYDWIH